MKKKNLLILVASLFLLGACGGTTPTESSKAATTSEATTTSETKTSETKTSETKTSETKTSETSSTTSEASESESSSETGSVSSETSEYESSSEEGEHVHTWVQTEKVGDVCHDVCECGEESYRIDVHSESEILEIDTQFNAVGLPRAQYQVLATVKSASADDSDRKWYNMATSDPVEETRTENADTAEDPAYRYHFNEVGVTINPTNKNSRAEDGINADTFTEVEMIDAADFGGEMLDLVPAKGMDALMYFETLRFVKVGEADKGYTVTFDCDEHCSVKVYKSQDYTAVPTAATTALSRDGDTGQITSSGDGQVNFVLVLDDGYTYNPLTGTEDCYKNIKLVDATNPQEPIFRITKICDDMTLTATTALIPEEESGFVATFVHPTDYTVTVFKTSTDAVAGTNGEVADKAFARTKDGVATSDASTEPQINFIINGTLPDGKAWKVTATEGAYKNIKQDPEGDGSTNYFRITKIKADLTVTIEVVDAEA